MIFPELAGQKLCQLWAFDQDNFPCSTSNSLLAGALAWEFEDAVLIFSSPLRRLHCTQGSVIGNEAGSLCDMGFRVTLLSHESADTWLARFAGRTTVDAPHWRRLIGQRLCGVGLMSDSVQSIRQTWSLKLVFCHELHPRCVTYRQDLDGLIEACDSGEHFELQQIEVSNPQQLFGWLHPAAPLEFILGEQMWRSAQMSDWPWPVRKQLQVSERPQEFYRDTFCKALMARFQQHPLYRQRLQALQYPVKVKDVPQDIYPQVRHELGIQDLATRFAVCFE